MKRIIILLCVIFITSCLVYSQEVYDVSGDSPKENKKKYNWSFGVSGSMRFYPSISGGAVISAKTPTKIPLVFGIDMYGSEDSFYLGGIFDVWFLNAPIGGRAKFYIGLGVVGGYTFTTDDYYDVGGRIPVGLSFGLDKQSRYELFVDLTPALMYRDAFSSDRVRYFVWTPSVGFRFSL